MKLSKIKYSLSNNNTSFKLYHPAIGFIESYSEFLEKMISRGKSKNTIASYAQDLKVFFEFLYAISFNDLKYLEIKGSVSEFVISLFPEYLALADLSDIEFVRTIALTNSRKSCSYGTSLRIISSVNKFLLASLKTQYLHSELGNKKLIDFDVSKDYLFESFNKIDKLRQKEKTSITKNSLLASVIKGGPKYANTFRPIKLLGKLNKNKNKNKDKKPFPFQYASALLENAPNPRDLCLWSLLFGTGIRQSEAFQLLIDDIDIDREEVHIYSPHARLPLYSTLPKAQKNKFEFKGRTTNKTYFIEPFKSIFFDNLYAYLRLRAKSRATHNCLFVSLSNNNRGNALIGINDSNSSFKAVQKKIGIELPYTLHSMRHFYGTWCLNFVKYANSNGSYSYGLPLNTVQLMMGHSSAKSTEVYAVIDEMVLDLGVQYYNSLLEGGSENATSMVLAAIETKMKTVRAYYENT